jgi:hypothetical protein
MVGGLSKALAPENASNLSINPHAPTRFFDFL